MPVSICSGGFPNMHPSRSQPRSVSVKIWYRVTWGATFISKTSKRRLWLVVIYVDSHHINLWRPRHRYSPKRSTRTVQWHVCLPVNWLQWPWQKKPYILLSIVPKCLHTHILLTHCSLLVNYNFLFLFISASNINTPCQGYSSKWWLIVYRHNS